MNNKTKIAIIENTFSKQKASQLALKLLPTKKYNRIFSKSGIHLHP